MKPPAEDNPLDPQDPLWEMLGRARPPAPADPWFTQKVMQNLPPQEPASVAAAASRLFAWLTESSPRVWVPAAAALAVAVAALHVMTPAPASIEATTVAGVPVVVSPTEDPQVDAVLEDLDALIAFEDPSVSLDEPM